MIAGRGIGETISVEDRDHLISVVQGRRETDPPLAATGTAAHFGRGLPPAVAVTALRLASLDRLLEHVSGDLTVTVEAGMPVDRLRAILRDAGQWIPALPQTGTVGGWITADRRGLFSAAWGTARDALLGITYVDGGGALVRAGSRVVKSVAGYDLMKLWTGSLGSFGALVEVTLKVLPAPESWGAVRLEGNEAPRAVLRTAVHDWHAAGLFRSRERGGGGWTAVFAGSRARVEDRVTAAANDLGDGSRVWDDADTRRAVAAWNARVDSRTRPVGWGGALSTSVAAPGWGSRFAGAEVLAETLSGEFWVFPETDVGLPERVALWRAALPPGTAHLHVDAAAGAPPRGDAWGSDPGPEGVWWRRIKTALDPGGVWVSGRLPGGV